MKKISIKAQVIWSVVRTTYDPAHPQRAKNAGFHENELKDRCAPFQKSPFLLLEYTWWLFGSSPGKRPDLGAMKEKLFLFCLWHQLTLS